MEGKYWFPGEGVGMSLMLHAFMDESGKLDKKIQLLAGYLADSITWNSFDRDWEFFLHKHDVPFLHVSKLKKWEEPYDKKRAEWGDAGRNEFLAEAAKIISEHLGRGYGSAICVGVAIDDWVSLKDEDRKRLGKHPDVFLFNIFMGFTQCLVQWQDDKWNRKSYLSLNWDEHSGAVHMLNVFTKSKIKNDWLRERAASMAFSNDEIYKGLQAADLLANTLHGEFQRQLESPSSPVDPIYSLLAAPGNHIVEELVRAENLDRFLALPWPPALEFNVISVPNSDERKQV